MTTQTPSPTALDRAAREESARHDAPDSKLSDLSALRLGTGASAVPANRVLQRVIMPRVDDPLEVRPLYLDEPRTTTGRTAEVVSRRSLTVPDASRVSFASYFNAFPASYWKRWTSVDEVALHFAAQGVGRVDLYRSKPNGDVVHLQGKQLDTGDQPAELEFRVSLAPFEDGGWIWFDVATRNGSLTVSNGAWTVDRALPEQRVALAITTFNRPADCVHALATLAEDPDVRDHVAAVFVIDQGHVHVRDHPEFAATAEQLGDRLIVLDQPNLGGSGGFTRGMFEAMTSTDVDHVLLLDDDVRIEPDSVLRVNAFASAATSPVIVGAQMLNLQAPARLHAMGEIVDLHNCYWRPAPGSVFEHDFAKQALLDQRLLHRRIQANYNGWWMCLIPRAVIEHVGLPLPLFIKWDDAEYSLRAEARGYPTVSLPGAAIWHMPWTDKNDATDWTAYFHMRNRLITMALHSPYDVRCTLVTDGLRKIFKHLMSMQYSTVALHLTAIEDFLAGPAGLFESLRSALPRMRELRQRYDDARTAPSAQQFPAASMDPVRVERMMQPPVNPAVIAAKAMVRIGHHLCAPDPAALERPQVNVPARSALWFLLGALDSATVSQADGAGVAFRRRDHREFRRLVSRTVAVYTRLVDEWPTASQTYRDALPSLTSFDAWRVAFDPEELG